MAKEFDLSMVSAERHRHGIGKAERVRQNISVAMMYIFMVWSEGVQGWTQKQCHIGRTEE